jgi:LuxR family transcriptional regulator, maltose regulon positive regulatory protein
MTAARARLADPNVGSGIDYLQGLAASHRGEDRAQEMLNSALEASVARGDDKGAALASAALLISGQVRGSYRRFPEHIARLAVVRRDDFPWNDADEELVALAGLLAGLIFFGSDDPFLDRCVERIMALLERDLDVNVKFAAGRMVMYYSEPRELRALGQRVFSLLRPGMDHKALTAHRLGQWLVYWARCARYAQEPRQAEVAEQQARQLAEAHNLQDILFWLAVIDVDRSLPDRNIAQAERALAAAEAVANPAHLGDMVRLEFLKTKLARMKGQGDRAVFHASRASKCAVELGYPPPTHAAYIVNEAQARLLIDDFATACLLLRQAAAMVPGHYADEVRDMIALTEAYAAMSAGSADGRALLAVAWGAIRERQFYDTFDGYPEFCAKLCVLALEHGIEVDFVRNLIASRNLAPPVHAPESWPWPIAVRALGGFIVHRRGEPLTFEGKAQKKPMELFRALIALGGRGVPKQKLYDLLWPDAEPDAAAAALDVVISRLRKLLGEPDAIRIEEGKVGLDPDRVWLDVWAFDADVEALQCALQGQTDASVVDGIEQRLLARYGGAFLGSEDPQRWSLVARDRWQNRFRRSLADAGRFWEQRDDWPRAIALYERALEEDSLAEELYRRLMRGHLARGEPAEAARVYRRCRDMLSVQLGIPPSADTEALFKSIYRNH